MGVTIKKKIIPIIKGAKIFPKNRPNLNQIMFKEVRILEFRIPKIKKIKETNKDQYLIFSSFING